MVFSPALTGILKIFVLSSQLIKLIHHEYHRIQYKLNMNSQCSPNFFMMPSEYVTIPSIYSVSLQPNDTLVHLMNQNQRLLQQNFNLRSEFNKISEEKRLLWQQNCDLLSKKDHQSLLQKRKYSKRRSWLQKKYKCNYQACRNCYSSKIALNLHRRKHHSTTTFEE